ncbi:hypothetical protein [Streptomyces canus]|uniref:hypothetical protein n=1 Tax=Streptomyces canus TaxID=58343 RepID=UPI0030E07876
MNVRGTTFLSAVRAEVDRSRSRGAAGESLARGGTGTLGALLDVGDGLRAAGGTSSSCT